MAKKGIVIRAREGCNGYWWDIALYDSGKMLMTTPNKSWRTKDATVRNAKALAKRIGIPYSNKIYKQHGC